MSGGASESRAATLASCPVCGPVPTDPVATLHARPAGEKDYGSAGPYVRQVVRCRSCGVFVNVHDLVPGTLYEGAYHRAAHGPSLLAAFRRIRALPPEESDNRGRVERVAEFLSGRGREPSSTWILDVGSGTAVFTAGLAELGFRCWAVDPDPEAVAHALRHGGVAGAHAGSLETLEPPRPFDLASFNKVLEHLSDPVGMLAAARPLLAPGGAVYVELPDGELALGVGSAAERQEFFAEHRTVWNARAVAALAQAAGFDARHVESLREPSGKCTVFAFLLPG